MFVTPELSIAEKGAAQTEVPGYQCDVLLPWENTLNPAKQQKVKRVRDKIKLRLFMGGKKYKKIDIPFIEMICNSFLKFHISIRDRSDLYFQKLTTASFCCLTAGMCSICSVILWAVLMWEKKTQPPLYFV